MRNDKNHTAWSGIYRPPQDISFFSRSMCVMHARNAISRTCNYLDGTRNNRGFSLKLSDLRDATLVSPMLSFFPAAVTLYPIFKSWFRSIFNEFFWNISIFRKQKGFSRFKNHEAVMIFFLNRYLLQKSACKFVFKILSNFLSNFVYTIRKFWCTSFILIYIYKPVQN